MSCLHAYKSQHINTKHEVKHVKNPGNIKINRFKTIGT